MTRDSREENSLDVSSELNRQGRGGWKDDSSRVINFNEPEELAWVKWFSALERFKLQQLNPLFKRPKFNMQYAMLSYGLKQTISFKFFKGCLLQILLGPLLNPLSHMTFRNLQFKLCIQLLLSVKKCKCIGSVKIMKLRCF